MIYSGTSYDNKNPLTILTGIGSDNYLQTHIPNGVSANALIYSFVYEGSKRYYSTQYENYLHTNPGGSLSSVTFWYYDGTTSHSLTLSNAYGSSKEIVIQNAVKDIHYEVIPAYAYKDASGKYYLLYESGVSKFENGKITPLNPQDYTYYNNSFIVKDEIEKLVTNK